MKSIAILFICFMLIGTTVAAAVPQLVQTPPQEEPTSRLYSHTILGEYATATWCGYCKYAHGALKNLYKGGWHPFYYISLVDDKNTHADARNSELGITGFPTVVWDGGYDRDIGAGSIPAAQATYNASIVSCGARVVSNVDLVLTVAWQGSATMLITYKAYNNESTAYSGHLRVFVCELTSSMGWYDTAGKLYTFPFLDYAFNTPITIPANNYIQASYTWIGAQHNDGHGHTFSGITQGNTIVIGALYNSNNNYIDDADGQRAGSNQPPNVPSSPQPSNGATNVVLNADLSWSGGDPEWFDTVTYDVYFEAGDSTPDVLVSDDQTATTYDPGTLALDTVYYWKIVATDNHGAVTSGPIWSFTTRGDNPPYVPSNPSPTNGATGAYTNSLLGWTGGDPDGDPVTYDVYFGTSTPPSKVAANHTGESYNPGTLAFDTTYYWKIVAWDSFDNRVDGPIWSFSTEVNLPPNVPSSPSPADGAIDVSTEADLTWTGGDPNPGDLAKYDVYFGTSSPPPLVMHNVSTAFYSPGTMTTETTYYWKIVSWDKEHLTATGPIWSFTTVDTPNYSPSDPEITGKTRLKVNTEYDFTFQSVDDNGDDIFYYVDWGDGGNSGWQGPYSSGESVVLSHTYTEKGSLTIQAKAKDVFDAQSDWGTLGISVPVALGYQSRIAFGFFPQQHNGMLRFWNGQWTELSMSEFKGYCGKLVIIGTIS
ncbi:MAG: hypothetical protein KKC68_07540 [Candidatus Thermoplasmatota archaeon]|nr:hypothetical protein [Candidatus Thermoplasmatota archaeon]MBU1941611.1 hypothetical protein [Candidatus Thermoplasmatota archaeon]